jgi:hypothetical protein
MSPLIASTRTSILLPRFIFGELRREVARASSPAVIFVGFYDLCWNIREVRSDGVLII